MSYVIVAVGHAAAPFGGDSPPCGETCVDGHTLRSGTYAVVVMELPRSQPSPGVVLARGYYAAFWPMDRHAPSNDERPLYFGPYADRRTAEALVRRVGTEVLPVKLPAPATRTQPGQAGAARQTLMLRSGAGRG